MTGLSVDAIATETGLAPRTVRGWLAEPDVQHQLTALHEERVRAIARRTMASAESSLSALEEIVTSTGVPAVVKVSAARTILASAVKFHEQFTTNERLSAIEERLDAATTEPQ